MLEKSPKASWRKRKGAQEFSQVVGLVSRPHYSYYSRVREGPNSPFTYAGTFRSSVPGHHPILAVTDMRKRREVEPIGWARQAVNEISSWRGTEGSR